MSWDRRKRLEAILRERIAVVVLERLNDPRLGFVTVTRVELTRDKSLARVYYTVLGNDSERRTCARALADAAPRILEIMGPSLRVRTLPELRFLYDETVERESRLLGILEDLEAERGEEAGPCGEDASPDPDDPGGPDRPA